MRWMLLIGALLGSQALAQSNVRRLLQDWQYRMEEHRDDGLIRDIDVAPVVLVSVMDGQDRASDALSNQTYSTASKIFGRQLMDCQECLRPEVRPGKGLYYRYGFISLDDVRNIYEGKELQPRSALWVAYADGSLSYRLVSLKTGRVIYSDTIQEDLDWNSRSIRNFTKSRMKERYGRQDAIYHHTWEMGLYPNFNLSYNFLNQWGENNDQLSGLTISVINPTLAIGAAYYKVLDLDNAPIVGAKLLVKIPEALASESGESSSGSSLVVQAIAKHPFPGNWGGLSGMVTVDTEGTVSIGVSW
ncbi:hypothetical protein [Pseudobacteriovorax antillogorgiicola]|uniref:Uncharacterized protein n=1 Tax=Pseudobacteriovorax antillogorgiicola TaxID=1513793 RepID=A0A1Y6CJV8_9BACT|nr:hypothetical protein [Pseudobacteriovorax antillogorgiicola]TCS45903.1 hypothetical protein EDD56_12666 [Pseudobacteriovorax antillogorgiicola]SMF71120.1 hypothetical protein SAMN06296036_12632 [Pseudobacteriovorax antillogorgiicola]